MLLKEKDPVLVTSEQTRVIVHDGSILKAEVQQPKNSHCLLQSNYYAPHLNLITAWQDGCYIGPCFLVKDTWQM